MKLRIALLGGLLAAMSMASAQNTLTLPETIEAGSAFSIQTSGTGKGTLYIVGPEQALKRDVQVGETTDFPAGTLFSAGQYLAILVTGSSTDQKPANVVPASHSADLSFLARPSRLPVNLRDGISGAVYVFDTYHNLITAPLPVSFELSNPSGNEQSRKATTRYGAAWTQMDSTAKEGADKFVAQVDGVTSTRVVQQVPGDPCGLKMNARQVGQQLEVETDPVRDCSGNAVTDGTIVTFTENYRGTDTTVDVPLKHGIAQVEMPAHNGATISVASGVVMGNDIHWGK